MLTQIMDASTFPKPWPLDNIKTLVPFGTTSAPDSAFDSPMK
jgi:hypothetical protein